MATKTGFKQGIEQGKEQGEMNAKITMFLNAKQLGLSNATIKELTGLGEDEIQKILDKINSV